MYKINFNERRAIKFTHFSRRGYALFSVLGKEVIIGVLSVATLQHASAQGMSNEAQQQSNDSTTTNNEAIHKLEGISVTGTRAPLTAGQQARMVTVLSREDIQAAPVQSINDLLKYAAGVDVRQKGPLGAQTDVSIRGGNQEQITVLLNGINICDPQTGHNSFDLPIDFADIDHIEILEGPAGRVYGTSSMLGAINIITKNTLPHPFEAHISGGSFGYFNIGARTGFSFKQKFIHTLSASYTRSDGYLRSKAGNLNADYKTGKAFYQGIFDNASFFAKWSAGVSTKDFGSNTFYGVKYDNQFEHTTKIFTSIQAENKKGVVHFRPSFYWNRNYDRFELFRDEPQKYPFNYHRTDVIGINLNTYIDWMLGRTALGFELRNEDIISGNLGEPLNHPKHIHGTDRNYTNGLNRTNTQIILEHNIILRDFSLSGGIIAVKNSQAEGAMKVYPSIDVSYRISPYWKLYASYNTALRMPSFTELYYSVGGFKADKHLKPEELTAFEIGTKYTSRLLNASLSIYHNRYRNLIDWINDGSTDEKGSLIWQSINFGTINALGIQLSGDLYFQQLLPHQSFLRKLSFSYSYINQDKKDGNGISSKYVLEYLKNKFVITLTSHWFAKLNSTLSYRFQHRMGQYLDVANVRHKYGSYGLLDTRFSWDEKKWSAYLEANNVLARKYADVGNVSQPRCWVTAGINISL